MTNFAQTNKQTFIDILKEQRIPCHAADIHFNSLGDDLGIETEDELEAVIELAGWLDLIYCYDELTLNEQVQTLWSCTALGARTDDWGLYVVDNGWIQICLTPTTCHLATQFDVSFKKDGFRNPNNTYSYPPTINGLIKSPSITEAVMNFKTDLKLQNEE